MKAKDINDTNRRLFNEGLRFADPEPQPEPPATAKSGFLNPEDRLKNVAKLGLKFSKPTRQHNGKGKASTYPVDADTMAQTLQHLSELVLKYLQDDLKLIEDDDCPF